MTEAIENASHKPLGEEKYFAARLLGSVMNLYGDRGKLYSGIYKYFRWVDDKVDTRESDQSTRIEFLDRQRSVLNEGILEPPEPDNHELALIELPWSTIPQEDERKVRGLLGGSY